jgi:hypothetical protein
MRRKRALTGEKLPKELFYFLLLVKTELRKSSNIRKEEALGKIQSVTY